MSSVRLSPSGRLGLRPCLAYMDALVPCVTKLGIASTSAVSEPRTTATTTTHFPRFPDGAALGAYGTDGRRCRGCWCALVKVKQTERKQCVYKSHILVMHVHYYVIDWS